jgi:hypothetical protein
MLPPARGIAESAVTLVSGRPVRVRVTSGPVVSEAPPPPAPRRWHLSPRRLALVLGVWAVAVGAALLIANALDSPTGAGARDEAQAVAPGEVAVPGQGPAVPLALVLDRPLPDGVEGLPPIRRAARLGELARSDPDPRRLVELGSALQLLGRPEAAAGAYRAALERAPDDLAARTGLAMVGGAAGAAGLARASDELRALARRHPGSQLVAFNEGWVEIYRSRAAPAERAWRRAVALGEGTRLGRTAAALLRELERRGGASP